MLMNVSLLTPSLEKQWDHFVASASQATVGHELGWRNVVERSYHHTPYYLMALEKGLVCGVLPLFLIRSKLFGRLLATAPFLSYGGLLANDSETAGKLVNAARKLTAEKKAKYAEIRGLNRVKHGLQLKEKYCHTF